MFCYTRWLSCRLLDEERSFRGAIFTCKLMNAMDQNFVVIPESNARKHVREAVKPQFPSVECKGKAGKKRKMRLNETKAGYLLDKTAE